MNRTAAHSQWLDRLAVGLSGLCLAHCMALPLLLAVFPAVIALGAGHAHFHALMLWLVVPVSLAGLYLGFRHHRMLQVWTVGLSGMALVFFGGTWAHGHWPLAYELAVNMLGSVTLATAHLINFRLMRRLPCEPLVP